jgi:hypothetical protein
LLARISPSAALALFAADAHHPPINKTAIQGLIARDDAEVKRVSQFTLRVAKSVNSDAIKISAHYRHPVISAQATSNNSTSARQ